MTSGSLNDILTQFDEFLKEYPPPLNVAIKINLQSLPSLAAPKTDVEFLERIIIFLITKGYEVTLVEGSNGHLLENLNAVGLGKYLENSQVKYIDLDTEKDILFVEYGNRRYPIPKVLTRMDLRLAVPCATKRPGYLFSCNVKTFVGLLPREFCKNATPSRFSRPIIHEDLSVTVSDLYNVVQETIPFHFFLNGGNTISEDTDIRELPQYCCSTNPIELDEYIANILSTQIPSYLVRLKEQKNKK